MEHYQLKLNFKERPQSSKRKKHQTVDISKKLRMNFKERPQSSKGGK